MRSGIVLTRSWKGVLHKVKVVENGYEHQGRTYESLSQIAHSITGTHRSGPLFFGLKDAKP
jgi:hypothetical protein